MGGRDFGEVASSLCVSTLNATLHKYFPRTLKGRRLADGGPLVDAFVQAFDTWIRDVNSVVYEFGSLDHRYREMGTTLVVLYHQEDFVVIAHVGDSRVYRIRDGAIEQITEDHSFVNSQLKARLITAEEAAQSAHKNIITRAIGTRATVKADVSVNPCRLGDVYLLCTDGLSDLVQPADMLGAMQKSGGDLRVAVDALVALANERGGVDNITVVLARIEPAAAAAAAPAGATAAGA